MVPLVLVRLKMKPFVSDVVVFAPQEPDCGASMTD
jgi:hypothetical protein